MVGPLYVGVIKFELSGSKPVNNWGAAGPHRLPSSAAPDEALEPTHDYSIFNYRRQTNSNDYLLANGSMSPIPVAFSLMASFMSAITLLGVTNENFAYGTQFIVINIAYAIGKSRGSSKVGKCYIVTKKNSFSFYS